MNDFETHDIGTQKEIKLSRELSNAIDQQLLQYGLVVPEPVVRAWKKLQEHYKWQIENEKM